LNVLEKQLSETNQDMKKASLYGAPSGDRSLKAAVCLLMVVLSAFFGGLVFFGGTVLAADPPQREVVIDTITVDGLERTKLFVVRRELLVKEGQTASIALVEESIQRLRNTGLFRKVGYDLVAANGDATEVDLQITVDEKWTTLPIFSFARGGGTYRLVLGAFDDNLLGRYIGIGGQYVRLGDANSFYGWLYHPRLFGQRLRGGIDVGTRNRIYTLFDDTGEVGGGFTRNRFTLGTYLRKEWLWWLRTQASFRWVNDDFSFDLLSPAVEALQRARGLPEPSHALVGGLSLILGRIDQDNYVLDGTLLSLTFEHANDAIGSSDSLTKLLGGLSHFESLPWKSNLSLRLAAGTSEVDAIHHRFYLGGLDAIRGFSSDRFVGEHYWLGNLEFRIPSVDTRWFVLQHVFFADAAGVGDDIGQAASLSGASAGLGLRILVPKIHGFVARVDYAFALDGDAANPLSLGGGQFF
jgi:outer membrane protein assembly factor BamA